MKRFGGVLTASGPVVIAAAIAWWWLTYRQVISYAYISPREAGYCLVGDTDICQLARALCRGTHPLAIIDYWSSSLWIGCLMLCVGLAVGERKRA